MAATNYTPIQLYYSTTASAAPTAGNLVNGELAINITDGKLYYKDNGGNVQVIATKGAGTIGGSNTQIQFNDGGALAGNAAMVFNKSTNVTTLTTLNLTNALGATYGGTAQSAYAQGDLLYASAVNTLSKLTIGTVNYILTSTGSVPQWVAPTSVTVQTANNLAGGAGGSVPYQSAADTTTFLAIGAANRVMTSSGSAPQWVTSLTGLTGVSSSSMTNTSLTSGRLVYSTTGGAQTDSANLTFNGTTLSTTGLSNTGFSTIVKTVTLGDSNFNGSAVFAPATPAKLYIGTGTVTDVTSAASATNTTGAVTAFGITPIAATNTAVTYTNASTLYIAGAPTAGTNITITNPYAFYVAGGASYFGGAVDFAVTPSYSGGTANGVMYLNASKQITTGSALTFSGTNLTIGSGGKLLYSGVSYGVGIDPDGSGGFGAGYNFETNGGTPRYLVTGPISGQYISSGSSPFVAWYLGSSAASGTAAPEQMRLTSTGLGIGTSSPDAKLNVAGTIGVGTTSAKIRRNQVSGSTGLVIQGNANDTVSDTNPGAYINIGGGPLTDGYEGNINLVAYGATTDSNRNQIIFSNRSGVNTVTERMRLDSSGNLGIGTSSPAQKLQVHGAIYANNSTNVAFLMQGSQYNGSIANTSTANTYSLGYTTDASTHTSVLYWNASGNLGLGVTPSAWASTYKAFQMGGGSLISYTGNDRILLGMNTYLDSGGNYTYVGSTYASGYNQVQGQHHWYTAPSGTAGNAITFTQAMTLTASGNLGIGATNPSSKVEAYGEIRNSSPADSGNKTQARLTAYRDGSNWGYIGYGDDAIMRIVYAATAGSYPLLFGTTSGFDNTGTFTQTMAMNSSGLLILKGGADTAAAGVAFPATQVASSNANTLDDYEEGSWTPVLGGDGGQSSQSYTARNGRYTKVGNICFVEFDVELSNKGTITGTATISGLPFTALAASDISQGGGSITYFSNLGVNVVSIIPGPQPNQTYLYPRYLTAAAATITVGTAGSTLYNDNTRLVGMCWYQVN